MTVVGFPFTKVREYCVTSASQAMKLDWKFCYDFHFVIQIFEEILVNFTGSQEERLKLYLDYILDFIQEIFCTRRVC